MKIYLIIVHHSNGLLRNLSFVSFEALLKAILSVVIRIVYLVKILSVWFIYF